MRYFSHIVYFWVGTVLGFICSYFYLHHDLDRQFKDFLDSLRYVHSLMI